MDFSSSPKLEVLARLLRELPPPGESGEGEDQDRRSRATLALIVERALGFASNGAEPIPESPATCPNCGGPAPAASPYCSTRCREESAFIRQLRRAIAEGTAFDAERQASMGQVLWHLLGGGYPRRQSLVNEKARLSLFKKHGGVCLLCGSPATTFDHIETACNRPINLRPVCASCTRTKQFGDESFLAASEIQSQLAEIARRVANDEPIHCCDDPEAWDWRAYMAKRKAGA